MHSSSLSWQRDRQFCGMLQDEAFVLRQIQISITFSPFQMDTSHKKFHMIYISSEWMNKAHFLSFLGIIWIYWQKILAMYEALQLLCTIKLCNENEIKHVSCAVPFLCFPIKINLMYINTDVHNHHGGYIFVIPIQGIYSECHTTCKSQICIVWWFTVVHWFSSNTILIIKFDFNIFHKNGQNQINKIFWQQVQHWR